MVPPDLVKAFGYIMKIVPIASELAGRVPFMIMGRGRR